MLGAVRTGRKDATGRWGRRLAAWIAVALGATLGACGKTEPPATGPGKVWLYGADGNMLNGLGAKLPLDSGGLFGMKGTAPLSPLPEGFRNRLRSVDGKLTDFLYSAESYDAVVISALAAELARSLDPTVIAQQINGVTTGGTDCDTVERCLDLARSGQDLAYRGITLQVGGFTDAGEPAAGSYGVLRFGPDNKIDDAKTVYVPAGDVAATTSKRPPASNPESDEPEEPLRLGSLLPRTGSLAALGRPMFAGVKLALKEINAAGGVFGEDVEYIEGDDFTDPAKAKSTVDRLINEGVQVIIGAGASSISKAVLPTVVANKRILFSPSNTAAELTTADDKGLYFRTAPPDGLQARALSDIIMRDGSRRLYIVARADAYGQGLSDGVKTALVNAGVPHNNIRATTYDPEKPDFLALGTEVKAFQPDGVLVIGYEETSAAIDAVLGAGLRSRG